MMLLKGVIAFPSFHAALAMLFTYAHRRLPTFLPMAVFNGLMLLAIPSEGGHYLVDIIGGGAGGGGGILPATGLPPPGPARRPAATAQNRRAGRPPPRPLSPRLFGDKQGAWGRGM